MSPILERAVVRLLTIGPTATPAGGGCLVSDNAIVTCAHVIRKILGLQLTDEGIPSGEVMLDFPLVAPNKLLRATVSLWLPEQDLAGLVLADPIPEGAKPVRLTLSHTLWGHPFRAFGFPAKRPTGDWATGEVRSRQASGWIQVEGTHTAGYAIEPGFSGTPVWDDQLGGVIGLVTRTEQDAQVKAAFIIPSEAVRDSWPESIVVRQQPRDEYLQNLMQAIDQSTPIKGFVDLACRADRRYVDRNGASRAGEPWPKEFRILSDSTAPEQPFKAQPAQERMRFASLLALSEKIPRFVILGDPGMGKSTSLNYLAYIAAERCLHNESAPVPLLLNLSAWGRQGELDIDTVEQVAQPTLAQFLAFNWPLASHLEDLIAEGEVCVFLDGLNEMGEHSADFARQLREWIGSPRGPRYCVLTCRADDYTSELDLNLPTVMLDVLDEAAIKTFVGLRLKERAAVFLDRLHTKKEALELAETPYYLAAMLFLYTHTEAFPDTLAQLLKQLNVLGWQREADRRPDMTPLETINRVLARIAFTMIEQNQPLEVSNDWMIRQIINKVRIFQKDEDRISAARLLEDARASGIVAVHARRVTFKHQLLQEYFAATELLNKPTWAPTDSSMREQSTSRHHWDQVVMLSADILPAKQHKAFFDRLLRHNIDLATKFRLASVVLSEAESGKLLSQYLWFHSPKYIVETLLPQLNLSQDFLDTLLLRMENYPAISTMEVMGEAGSPRLIPHLELMVKNTDYYAQEIRDIKKKIAQLQKEIWMRRGEKVAAVATAALPFVLKAASAILLRNGGQQYKYPLGQPRIPPTINYGQIARQTAWETLKDPASQQAIRRGIEGLQKKSAEQEIAELETSIAWREKRNREFPMAAQKAIARIRERYTMTKADNAQTP